MKCSKCKGSGKTVATHSGSYNISFSAKLVPCPTCNGTGKIKKYRTIYADPPWEPTLGKTWKTRFTDKARPQKFYNVLTVDKLCLLIPPSLEQAHLWLWVINQHIDWGYEVARAWGFEPWNIITWCKSGLGTGRFQCNTEHILICRKGKRYGNPFGFSHGTWFQWKRQDHSSKPTEIYTLIEKISPPPYLELFARKKREGWDVWGNEVESTIELYNKRSTKTCDQCPHCESYNVEYSNCEWFCLDCGEQWDQYGQDTK